MTSNPRRRPRPSPSLQRVAPRAPSLPTPAGPAEPPAVEDRPQLPTGGAARPASLSFDRVDSTAFFAALDGIAPEPRDSLRPPEASALPSAGCSDPTDPLWGVAEIAHQYLRSGADRLASAMLDALCELRPDEPWLWLARGLAKDRLHDSDAAVDSYRRAAVLAPRDPTAWLNLAELALEKKKTSLAARFLNEADRRLPADRSPLRAKRDAICAALNRSKGGSP